MQSYTLNRPDGALLCRVLEQHTNDAAGAILRLAWMAGLMRDEIQHLTWAQVDLLGEQLLLPDRAVPLAPELAAWLEQHRLELHHWFFSTDLTFYVRGGRISKASGWFGTMLHICPLLNMDDLGRLIPRFKIRGKNKVIREIVARMVEHAQNGTDYSGRVTEIGSMVNPSTGLYDVKAEVDQADGLPSGQAPRYFSPSRAQHSRRRAVLKAPRVNRRFRALRSGQ